MHGFGLVLIWHYDEAHEEFPDIFVNNPSISADSTEGRGSKGKPFNEWPWAAQALIVIAIIVVVLMCLCLCCGSNKSDDDNGEAVNLSNIQNTPDEHFNPIKTVQETPNPMTCPAHLQESNTLPYPSLPSL